MIEPATPSELADPLGTLKVGKHQDVEQLGAGSGAECVQALAEPALGLVGSHGRRLTPALKVISGG
jgi:hypothetical protein